MANKNSNSELKGHLYIGCPILETLAPSCVSAEDTAHTSNIECSNFLKACKMGRDIRLNTYRKCAAGLGKEVLIVRLPLETIESMTKPKARVRDLYKTIELDELIKVLMKVTPSDGMKIVNFMKKFKGHLTRHDKENLMKPSMSATVELCQDLLSDNGKPWNILPNE